MRRFVAGALLLLLLFLAPLFLRDRRKKHPVIERKRVRQQGSVALPKSRTIAETNQNDLDEEIGTEQIRSAYEDAIQARRQEEQISILIARGGSILRFLTCVSAPPSGISIFILFQLLSKKLDLNPLPDFLKELVSAFIGGTGSLLGLAVLVSPIKFLANDRTDFETWTIFWEKLFST